MQFATMYYNNPGCGLKVMCAVVQWSHVIAQPQCTKMEVSFSIRNVSSWRVRVLVPSGISLTLPLFYSLAVLKVTMKAATGFNQGVKSQVLPSVCGPLFPTSRVSANITRAAFYMKHYFLSMKRSFHCHCSGLCSLLAGLCVLFERIENLWVR